LINVVYASDANYLKTIEKLDGSIHNAQEGQAKGRGRWRKWQRGGQKQC